MRDISGQRFGMLTVLEPTHKRTKQRRVIWECRCDCGSIYYANSNDLMHGRVLSCGCSRLASISKHAKDVWELSKKDIGVQDGTNISVITGKDAFVTTTTGVRGVNSDGEGKFKARLQFQGKKYTKRGFKSIDDAKKERDRMYEEIVVPYLKSVGKL